MRLSSVFVPLGLTLLVGFAPVARTRAGGLLGALYDSCLGTLGEPVNYTHLAVPAPGAEVYAFRQAGWLVTVFFWKHQAHLIVYEKPAGANILPAEADAILRGYGDALPWTRRNDGHRVRRDGRAKARVSATEVAIFSTEFDQANSLYVNP